MTFLHFRRLNNMYSMHQNTVTPTGIAVALAVAVALALLFFGPAVFAPVSPVQELTNVVTSTTTPMTQASAIPTVIPSELTATDLVVGTGAEATAGSRVTVHYVGRLTDGTVFDASEARGQAFTFDLGAGQVIRGWDVGVVGMKVGGTRQLIIPAAMAYGERGAGALIPPGATLVFDVTLLGVE
jgi:FKBP-type peptidyl-prolyl cis-trans isomerase